MMFLIFGQFWNQTTLTNDWQQIGGTATHEQDAFQFAEGFCHAYKVNVKVHGRNQIWYFSHGDTWVGERRILPRQGDKPLVA
jgi:hypothetical protein